MPVEAFRLTPRHLSYQGDFQREHQARVDRPLATLDLDELFQNVQANLYVGDKIEIVSYRDNNYDEVVEIGECRIIAKGRFGAEGPPRIKAVWTGEIFKIPDQDEMPAAQRKPVTYDIRPTHEGGYVVHDEKGAALEQFRTKEEADDYVARMDEHNSGKRRRGRPPKDKAA